MPQSLHSGGSMAGGSTTTTVNTTISRHVDVILLNKETIGVNIESKNTKVADVFHIVCEHIEVRETEFFGLAQLKDNGFQFLQQDTKISKLASKIWKSKELSADEPMLTFYLLVQYYVDNIGLLKEKSTRLQYYLQLRENLLNYHKAVMEEKCFLLASYALQADFGNYKPSFHATDYFDPRKYFPTSVVMRRGQDYITTHLPLMHKTMSGMMQTEARVKYIMELSTPPIAHNFHFYKMRKRKYDTDTAGVIWIAICPHGIDVYEEPDDFRCQLSSFLWPDIGKLHCDKKKFEITTDGNASRKYTFYADSKEWAEFVLDFCRQSHNFQMKIQPRIIEMRHLAACDNYHEMYVYSENAEFTLDRRRSGGHTADGRYLPALDEQSTDISSSSDRTVHRQRDNVIRIPSAEEEQKEILILTPPHELPQSFQVSGTSLKNEDPKNFPAFRINTEHEKQLLKFSFLPNQVERVSKDDIGVYGVSFNQYLTSSPVWPDSSNESLISSPFTKADSFHRDHPPVFLSLSSSSSSYTQSLAASALMTPSQRSSSPSSSAGSGQLPLSLPSSQLVYDAAFLRQSVPHGKTFNEYVRQIYSGQEMAEMSSSDCSLATRKSSLDYHQLHPNALVEPVQRSTSLRQPMEARGDFIKSKKLSAFAAFSSQPVVTRSESNKSQKSYKLALQSSALNQPAVCRSDSNKSQKSVNLALHSDLLSQSAVSRSDSNKSQKSVTLAYADVLYQPTVTRSDSNSSQKLALLASVLSQPGIVTRSDSNKSQKSSALTLHPDSLSQAMVQGDSSQSQKVPPLSMTSDILHQLPTTHSDTSRNQNSMPLDVPNQSSAVRNDSRSQKYSAYSMHHDASSAMKSKENVVSAISGLPLTMMPVEAQIQKLRFVPTMTAISTPVLKSTPEKPAGSLPVMIPYNLPPAYIPESFPASGRPTVAIQASPSYIESSGLAASGFCSDFPRYQEISVTATSSDINYPHNTTTYSAEASMLHQQLPAHFVPVQSLVQQPVEDEMLYSDLGNQRVPSPPPYGAPHATINSTVPAARLPAQLIPQTVDVAEGTRFANQQVRDNGMKQQLQQNHLQIGSSQPGPSVVGNSALPWQVSTGYQSKGTGVTLSASTSAVKQSQENNSRVKKVEMVRHESDRCPGFRNPHCPRHGSGLDLRERLRSLGPSVPPMLNALLTDKSLHDTCCTCTDSLSGKRLSNIHTSNSFNFPASVTRPISWNSEQCLNDERRLQYFSDLSLNDNDATMIINGTMNGTLHLDEADEDDQSRHCRSNKTKEGNRNIAHRSYDLEQRQLLKQQQQPYNHNQSNSDTMAQNVVSSEC